MKYLVTLFLVLLFVQLGYQTGETSSACEAEMRKLESSHITPSVDIATSLTESTITFAIATTALPTGCFTLQTQVGSVSTQVLATEFDAGVTDAITVTEALTLANLANYVGCTYTSGTKIYSCPLSLDFYYDSTDDDVFTSADTLVHSYQFNIEYSTDLSNTKLLTAQASTATGTDQTGNTIQSQVVFCTDNTCGTPAGTTFSTNTDIFAALEVTSDFFNTQSFTSPTLTLTKDTDTFNYDPSVCSVATAGKIICTFRFGLVLSDVTVTIAGELDVSAPTRRRVLETTQVESSQNIHVLSDADYKEYLKQQAKLQEEEENNGEEDDSNTFQNVMLILVFTLLFVLVCLAVFFIYRQAQQKAQKANKYVDSQKDAISNSDDAESHRPAVTEQQLQQQN